MNISVTGSTAIIKNLRNNFDYNRLTTTLLNENDSDRVKCSISNFVVTLTFNTGKIITVPFVKEYLNNISECKTSDPLSYKDSAYDQIGLYIDSSVQYIQIGDYWISPTNYKNSASIYFTNFYKDLNYKVQLDVLFREPGWIYISSYLPKSMEVCSNVISSSIKQQNKLTEVKSLQEIVRLLKPNSYNFRSWRI